MTTNPKSIIFNPIVHDNTSLEMKPVFFTSSVNRSRFDKLFALVFGNEKIQKLTTQADYSDMLGTIAKIAATK